MKPVSTFCRAPTEGQHPPTLPYSREGQASAILAYQLSPLIPHFLHG